MLCQLVLAIFTNRPEPRNDQEHRFIKSVLCKMNILRDKSYSAVGTCHTCGTPSLPEFHIYQCRGQKSTMRKLRIEEGGLIRKSGIIRSKILLGSNVFGFIYLMKLAAAKLLALM